MGAAPMPSQPPAGWYDDPSSPAAMRWWDGTRWTEHRQHKGAPAPAVMLADPYRSPERLSRVLLVLLGAMALIDLAAIPLRGTPSSSDAIDNVWGVSFLITAVVFVVWFRRMYRNLPSLGARELRWSPGWAVGAWFVPFLNLWRPVQIACDISRASDPTAPAELGGNWHTRAADQVITVWWALFLGSNFVWSRTNVSVFGEQASDLLEAGAAIACALVVWRLTQQHVSRAIRLKRA